MSVVRRGTRPRIESRWFAVLLPLAIAAGCRGETPDPGAGDTPGEPAEAPASTVEAADDQACVPTEPDLAPEASLAGMSGDYRLTLETAGAQPASTEGLLTLRPLPEALQEMAGAATPLGGSADIDVEAVGALRLGDLGSDNPAAPGVLVIETAGPSIMLRLGSEPNRRDQVSFDLGYTVLTVHQIGTTGFAGSWRSGSGGVVNEGYFCARRSAG